MLNSISEEGNYLSIACDEADDEDFLDELSKLTTKNIKMYANTNKTTIGFSSKFTYVNKEVSDYGSIFNIPLTTNFPDTRGWFCFDCSSQSKEETGKDIVLNSFGNKEKPFKLVPLGSVTSQKKQNRNMYYSKKFKKWFEDNWGKVAYDKWKEEMKKSL